MLDKIHYSGDFPPEVRAALESHLSEWAWLIPSWCERVTVHYLDNGEDGTGAETETNYEYRWAVITFYQYWFSGDESRRRDNVIHELLHISTNNFADYASNMVEDLTGKKNPQFNELAQHHLRVYHESMVQDLTFALMRGVRPDA